jgi:hypothetical protein
MRIRKPFELVKIVRVRDFLVGVGEKSAREKR